MCSLGVARDGASSPSVEEMRLGGSSVAFGWDVAAPLLAV